MSGTHRRFVSYIDRSRDYYAAQGYPRPYRWAVHDDVPFTAVDRPLSEARIGIVTTAARNPDDVTQPFAAPTDPVPDAMYTDHLHWHHAATDTDDLGAFLPLDHLRALVTEGRIGSVSARYYGIPTNYSHRRTRLWAQSIRDWIGADEVDLVLLVPL